LCRRPEGARASTQRQTHRIREQDGLRLNGHRRIDRQIKSGRLNREDLERRIQNDDIILSA
jgi:hypothetical protein